MKALTFIGSKSLCFYTWNKSVVCKWCPSHFLYIHFLLISFYIKGYFSFIYVSVFTQK